MQAFLNRNVATFLGIAFFLAANSAANAQQVAPTPVAPTPLISSQTSTACLVSCDTQLMNCQNACVIVGPTSTSTTTIPGGTTSAAGASACALNCTTQQLVCKQVCNRPQQ